MIQQIQKQGDTRKAMWRTNFSLLDSTVDLKVKSPDGAMVDTAGKVEITDPYYGIVAWDHEGSLQPGTYEVELWITRDGELFKAPSQGYSTLTITPHLA